jgi:16S rRNA (cytidine1402-2'-O)-methyltransferase
VIERCLAELGTGRHLALVTDAGTPLISDPGARLVRGARELGARVETIPGPSAVTAALSICGMDFDSFRFMGFAPRSGQKRRAWLEQIAGDAGASVFFESKARLLATLAELGELLAEGRALAVCRELTKIHEQVVRGTAAELLQALQAGVLGEITVVVGAGPTLAERNKAAEPSALEPRIEALLAQGVSPRDAARQIARETGLARRIVYARVQGLVTRGGMRRPSPAE